MVDNSENADAANIERTFKLIPVARGSQPVPQHTVVHSPGTYQKVEIVDPVWHPAILTRLSSAYNVLMPISGFDPLIADWFGRRFAAATEPQVLGWPEIRAGRDVLISAPTGSGKTLSA